MPFAASMGRLSPESIISGPGCRSEVTAELDRLGAAPVVVVCGASLKAKTPFVDELAAALGRARCCAFRSR